MADDHPLNANDIPMTEVMARAKEAGCYMQAFVAYNPKTEMILLATNAPSGDNGTEAALLFTLAADEAVKHMAELAAKAGGNAVPEGSAAAEGDDAPTVN